MYFAVLFPTFGLTARARVEAYQDRRSRQRTRTVTAMVHENTWTSTSTTFPASRFRRTSELRARRTAVRYSRRSVGECEHVASSRPRQAGALAWWWRQSRRSARMSASPRCTRALAAVWRWRVGPCWHLSD